MPGAIKSPASEQSHVQGDNTPNREEASILENERIVRFLSDPNGPFHGLHLVDIDGFSSGPEPIDPNDQGASGRGPNE